MSLYVPAGIIPSDGLSSRHVLFWSDFNEKGYFTILLKIISGTVKRPYLNTKKTSNTNNTH